MAKFWMICPVSSLLDRSDSLVRLRQQDLRFYNRLLFYLGRYVEDSLVALAAVSKSGRLIKKDDVVLCTVAGHPQVGKIGFFSKVDDSYFALVKIWESSNDVNTFVVSEDHARWIQLADIEGAFAWRYASHDHVLISPPHV